MVGGGTAATAAIITERALDLRLYFMMWVYPELSVKPMETYTSPLCIGFHFHIFFSSDSVTA